MGVAGCRIGILPEDDNAHPVQRAQPEGCEHQVRRWQHRVTAGKAQVQGMADAICLPGREERQVAPPCAGVIVQKGRKRAAAGARG